VLAKAVGQIKSDRYCSTNTGSFFGGIYVGFLVMVSVFFIFKML